MKHVSFIIIIVMLLVMLLISIAINIYYFREIYNRENYIPIELVCKLETHDRKQLEYDVWFVIGDSSEFSFEKLSEFCDTDQLPGIDLNTYTYIVTSRYTIKEMSYNEKYVWGRIATLGTNCVYWPLVIMEDSGENESVYIYRTPNKFCPIIDAENKWRGFDPRTILLDETIKHYPQSKWIK